MAIKIEIKKKTSTRIFKESLEKLKKILIEAAEIRDERASFSVEGLARLEQQLRNLADETKALEQRELPNIEAHMKMAERYKKAREKLPKKISDLKSGRLGSALDPKEKEKMISSGEKELERAIRFGIENQDDESGEKKKEEIEREKERSIQEIQQKKNKMEDLKKAIEKTKENIRAGVKRPDPPSTTKQLTLDAEIKIGDTLKLRRDAGTENKIFSSSGIPELRDEERRGTMKDVDSKTIQRLFGTDEKPNQEGISAFDRSIEEIEGLIANSQKVGYGNENLTSAKVVSIDEMSSSEKEKYVRFLKLEQSNDSFQMTGETPTMRTMGDDRTNRKSKIPSDFRIYQLEWSEGVQRLNETVKEQILRKRKEEGSSKQTINDLNHVLTIFLNRVFRRKATRWDIVNFYQLQAVPRSANEDR